MSSKLKDIKLYLDKNNKLDNFILDKKYFLDKVKSILKPDSIIVTVEINDLSIIKEIYNSLNKKCKIIVYIKNRQGTLKARKELDSKDIIVINKTFEKNDIKSNIADFVIGSNVLKENGNNGDYIKEINRVLKSKGNFTFFEVVNAEKNGIAKSCIKNKKESPVYYSICTVQSKLNYIKNSEYELEIFNSDKKKEINNKIKNLKEFSSILKQDTSYQEMLSSNLMFVLSGMKKA